MDKVPYHIEQLESEMSDKWHNQLTMDEMVETHQEWVIKKYFLDASGHPDRTKMVGVLIVPVPFRSTKRAGKVIDAAKKVNGLHYGRRGDYLCIGWSEAAVEVTVRDDAGRFESEETYISRDEERNLMHTKYLREAKSRHTKRGWSPVGSFIVDCDEIEAQWPKDADNMTLDLHKTDLPNVFFARFDFGIHEGVMILSGSKAALQQYCDELERGDDDEEQDRDDDDDDEIQPAAGSKRKAKGKGNRSRKKQSAQNEAPGKLFLRWKGAETGTGEILHRAEEGSISFQDAERSVFFGKIDMTYVGRNVSFTARKVSDIPKRGKNSWNDYSFAAYERARKSRWGGSRWI